MTNENTKLWDSVCTTDPDMTSRVTQRGGFTAIDAYYTIQRLTEKFGPIGKGWGGHVSYEFQEGLVVCVAEFWHADGAEKHHAPAILTSNEMIFTDSSGKRRVDEDAGKKALTDAMTKWASYLGFSADVFLGKFDDNRYVDGLKKLKKAQETRPTAQELYGTAKARTDRFNAIAAELRACTEHHELGEVWKANQNHIRAMGAEDEHIQAELVKIKDQCKAAIEEAKVAEASFSQGFNETKY